MGAKLSTGLVVEEIQKDLGGEGCGERRGGALPLPTFEVNR